VISDIEKESYTIKYEDVFSGPIELLLELIQKKKVDIYDIKLSYIINGFAEYIKEKGGVLLDTISSFIYFSSILLEIKSRSLLPSKAKDDGEEGELDVSILKRREEEYRTYKKVSNYLNNKSLEGSLFFIREAPMEKELMNILPDFMEKLDTIELWTIACRLFTRMKMDLDLEDVYDHRSTITIFDEMERIKNVLSGRKEVTFREISSVYGKVIDRIVSFLSVLELYKNEEVEIVQFESFGNIIIKFK
jgi:segregation and condensation protein A